MLSDKAEIIIKNVKNIRTEGIKDLLEDYPERPQRDFIQKYAETEIAVCSLTMTILAYTLALILFVVSVGLNIVFVAFSDYGVQHLAFFEIRIIVPILVIVVLIYFFNKHLSEKKLLQDIIIAIEDANKLKANEQVESLFLLKLNEISGEVESINLRIDILEKTVTKNADIMVNE